MSSAGPLRGQPSPIGALLLGYYTDDGRLHYAGRAGTGITDGELKLAGAVSTLLLLSRHRVTVARLAAEAIAPALGAAGGALRRVSPAPAPDRAAGETRR